MKQYLCLSEKRRNCHLISQLPECKKKKKRVTGFRVTLSYLQAPMEIPTPR